MTTLKMKAVAARLCVAKSREDIIEAQKEAQSQNQELLILGGGSNTVLLQEQVDKFVVRNQYVQKKIVSENDEYVDLSISSGYPVGLLVNQTVKDGLSGF
ncbi:MAG: FAD-binding protein, partial [Patescibacteria group bacterium]